MAKTMELIRLAVTAKLICAFVFANADCWFSHAAAQMLSEDLHVLRIDIKYSRAGVYRILHLI